MQQHKLPVEKMPFKVEGISKGHLAVELQAEALAKLSKRCKMKNFIDKSENKFNLTEIFQKSNMHILMYRKITSQKVQHAQ